MLIINAFLKNSILRKYLNFVLVNRPDAIVRDRYFQFRCNVCGDSKKNKAKKRGYLLFHNNRWSFKCHNCSISMSAENWLKRYFPIQYKQYIIELLQNKQNDNKPILAPANLPVKEKKIDEEQLAVSSFVPVLNGKTDIFEKAKNFCIDRKIPEDVWKKWFVSTKGKYGGRLIIPFYDKEGKIYHYQGRTLCGQEPKYLNRVGNEKIESIYNKYVVDCYLPIIVQEGPINALFVENSIATCGLSFSDDFITELEKLGTLWFLFDFDEPGIDKSRKMLEKGKTVFLWMKYIKDIGGIPYREKWDTNDLCLYQDKQKLKMEELKPYFSNSNFDSIYL